MQTAQLPATPHGVAAASRVLAKGGLLAFPTETVYGLGADARNDHAVARIFAAKGRPSFNPLIVHVASISAAQALVAWTAVATKLAAQFWPGPMTLVLPLKPDNGLSALVTANLPSLAIRIPANPLARDLLDQFGGPVAAPSANPSGRISPTTARHVIRGLDGQIDAVIDGGDCAVGLESTIIGLEKTPTLLRPGGLASGPIEACLGQPLTHHHISDTLNAPGQMRSHYAPTARLRLNATSARSGEVLLGFGDVPADLNLSASRDLVEAAANLFRHLHTLDTRASEVIAVSPIPKTGLGLAINDRLQRAAAPRSESEAAL
ncbi:MAG: threonylcarbamoyl-AMP synthase [Rhodobacteraceae bacterium]|jgi:L-threonylcarbamoyladenylate synthase|nr:threonylcarbamoyl-AMP synthase [Paracoccaceae bacterium]